MAISTERHIELGLNIVETGSWDKRVNVYFEINDWHG